MVVSEDGIDKVIHDSAIATAVAAAGIDLEGFGTFDRCEAVDGDDAVGRGIADDFSIGHADFGDAAFDAVVSAHGE